MVKTLKLGDGASHPRAVSEAVHGLNVKRMRRHKGGAVPGLRTRTFDVKDFFTSAPRGKFREELRQAIQMARAVDPTIRYFSVGKEGEWRGAPECKNGAGSVGAWRRLTASKRLKSFFSKTRRKTAD